MEDVVKGGLSANDFMVLFTAPGRPDVEVLAQESFGREYPAEMLAMIRVGANPYDVLGRIR